MPDRDAGLDAEARKGGRVCRDFEGHHGPCWWYLQSRSVRTGTQLAPVRPTLPRLQHAVPATIGSTGSPNERRA